MSLRGFLDMMERKGEVLHVREALSTRFEVSAVLEAFSQDGSILHFENIKGYDTEVIGNICGSRSRIHSALNVSDDRSLYERMIEAFRSPVKPRVVDDAAVMEVYEEPDLHKIPVLTHYEGDAGPYITSAIISARSPDGKVENVSIHRLLILDRQHLAIRLVPRHLYRLWTAAKKEGKDLDVAIAIGVHPAVSLAAASTAPFGISEFWIANKLLDNNLELIRCERVDAYAPADAELILEGRISAKKEVDEGPLVDITGTHDIRRKQPVIEVVGVMHRRDYIYQALLPGGCEHRLLMGLPREVMIYESVLKVVPDVKAVNLTVGGCGWLHAVISIEKQSEGDGKNALLAAFTGHPSLKHAVVVDSDIDIYDPRDVEWAIATRFQGGEDLIVIPNVRGSTLDPSANQNTGLTTKIGIDATRPLGVPKERFKRATIPSNRKVRELIRRLKSSS